MKGMGGMHCALEVYVKVTQGHWKRNYWIDHTRLTIGRVI